MAVESWSGRNDGNLQNDWQEYFCFHDEAAAPSAEDEHERLKEYYSQCLQQSVPNLSQAFVNFLEGRAKYPKFQSKS
ncbi:MAG: hypothetical protein SNJ85_08890 [Cyanobacteriota bacterium]